MVRQAKNSNTNGVDLKQKILDYLASEVEVSSLEEELVKTGTFHALASREMIKAMEQLSALTVERERVDADVSTNARIELEATGEKVTEKRIEERVKLNPLWQEVELKYQMAKSEVEAWKAILRSLEVRREIIQFFLRSEIKT